ncbi:MAG: hypothetical protein ABEK01_02385 [Candidatus Nanohaloarchaea archaeon]
MRKKYLAVAGVVAGFLVGGGVVGASQVMTQQSSAYTGLVSFQTGENTCGQTNATSSSVIRKVTADDGSIEYSIEGTVVTNNLARMVKGNFTVQEGTAKLKVYTESGSGMGAMCIGNSKYTSRISVDPAEIDRLKVYHNGEEVLSRQVQS